MGFQIKCVILFDLMVIGESFMWCRNESRVAGRARHSRAPTARIKRKHMTNPTPWFLRAGSWTQSFPLLFFSLSSLSRHRSPPLPPLPLSPGPPWLPRASRRSAARTGTRRRSSWSPSSPSCSGLWVWPARLWASHLPFYSSCQSVRGTGDWASTRCPGPRPPPGSSSSSLCVTSWDAQVKSKMFIWAQPGSFSFLSYRAEKRGNSFSNMMPAGSNYARKYSHSNAFVAHFNVAIKEEKGKTGVSEWSLPGRLQHFQSKLSSDTTQM